MTITPHLIESANRSYENDRVCVIEVWDPCVPLATSTADVEKVPGDRFAVHGDIEDMFRDSHGLDAGVEDVVYVQRFGVCAFLNKGRDIPVEGMYSGATTRVMWRRKLYVKA
jgi:hypothetical protein